MTTVPATSAASTAAQPASSAANSLTGLADNFDNFLKLLTTQLQHQDPTSPMDANQFTQELVQFAGVEQAINTNSNLETLIGLQKSNQAIGALSYMGKTVEAKSDQVPLVDGKAVFAYTLSSAADKVSYAISDSTGRVVYSGNGDATAGRHEYTWDGKSSSGVAMPNGAYTLTVAASDASGNPVDATTSIIGTVGSVEIGDSGVSLAIGAVSVPADQLVAIINNPA